MEQTIRRLVRIATVTLCAAAPASAALAAHASAATITVDKACYVNTNPARGATMTVTGAGFGANDPVDISGGTAFDSVNADANGNFVATTSAPTLATNGPGVKATTLTATDENTSVSATVVADSANLSVSTTPGSVRNVRRDKVTYRFSGFTPGQHIVGYYFHRRKQVAKSVFKPAQGPCGTLTQRALLFPGGRPAKLTYLVTFESFLHYSRTAFPHITGSLDLFHY